MHATVQLPGFPERWAALAAERSPLCLGVAPSDRWLTAWGLDPGPAGARAYCSTVLEAAGDSLAVFKVQTPFFARFGPPGLDLLRWFTDRAHDRGSLVLMDAKVGDADDTMEAYADLYLGADSVLGGDAVTAQCFMGLPSLAPLLHRAEETGAQVFVLVRTSNHATDATQLARRGAGTVAQHLADEVSAWNRRRAPDLPIGPAAAVVGARSPESAGLYRRLATSLVEVPGLGRGDRVTAEVLGAAAPLRDRALFTVTTGVLRHGPDRGALRSSLDRWRSVLLRGDAGHGDARLPGGV